VRNCVKREICYRVRECVPDWNGAPLVELVPAQGIEGNHIPSLNCASPDAVRTTRPILELRDGNGSLVQTNGDWQTENRLRIAATGLQPSDSHESAIVATLASGNYAAIVRGKNNTTGIAFVEVYSVGN
jgi:hypothetical protein